MKGYSSSIIDILEISTFPSPVWPVITLGSVMGIEGSSSPPFLYQQ